jgi:hypothetical protein
MHVMHLLGVQIAVMPRSTMLVVMAALDVVTYHSKAETSQGARDVAASDMVGSSMATHTQLMVCQGTFMHTLNTTRPQRVRDMEIETPVDVAHQSSKAVLHGRIERQAPALQGGLSSSTPALLIADLHTQTPLLLHTFKIGRTHAATSTRQSCKVSPAQRLRKHRACILHRIASIVGSDDLLLSPQSYLSHSQGYTMRIDLCFCTLIPQ